jgi:hypothetical protein
MAEHYNHPVLPISDFVQQCGTSTSKIQSLQYDSLRKLDAMELTHQKNTLALRSKLLYYFDSVETKSQILFQKLRAVFNTQTDVDALNNSFQSIESGHYLNYEDFNEKINFLYENLQIFQDNNNESEAGNYVSRTFDRQMKYLTDYALQLDSEVQNSITKLSLEVDKNIKGLYEDVSRSLDLRLVSLDELLKASEIFPKFPSPEQQNHFFYSFLDSHILNRDSSQKLINLLPEAEIAVIKKAKEEGNASGELSNKNKIDWPPKLAKRKVSEEKEIFQLRLKHPKNIFEIEQNKGFSKDIALIGFLSSSKKAINNSIEPEGSMAQGALKRGNSAQRDKNPDIKPKPDKKINSSNSLKSKNFPDEIEQVEGDDYTFATCANEESIRIWMIEGDAFKCINVLKQHTDWVNRLLFLDEKGYLISSSSDKTIRIWNIKDFNCIHIISAHDDSVFGLTSFNELPLFASGSYDKTVKLWDKDDFSFKGGIELEKGVFEIRNIFIEELGSVLLAGDYEGQIYSIAIGPNNNMNILRKVKGHQGCVLRIVFLVSYKMVASSANNDRSVKIWNPINMNLLHKFDLHDDKGICGLYYDPQHEILISGGKDLRIRVLLLQDMETLCEICEEPSFTEFGSLAWVKEKQAMITCGGIKRQKESSMKMKLRVRYF